MTTSVNRSSGDSRSANSHLSRRGLRSRAGKLLAALVTGVLALTGFGTVVAPAAQATPTLIWSTAGTIPVNSGANVVALGYGNNVFMAVASDGVTYTSSGGTSWAAGGSLVGGTPPDAGYKTNIAYGDPAATPTWVVTDKDGGEIWTSTNNGTSWTLAEASGRGLKKLAYGDGHFLVGYEDPLQFRTSTDGLTWEAAGTITGFHANGEGRMVFGNNTFVIPMAYSDSVCRVSTLQWALPLDFNCTASHSNGGGYQYWQQIAFGNNTFVGPLDNNASNPPFWVSTDTGATWVSPTSFSGTPVGITFGGQYFVIDKSDGTTAYSADGMTWTNTGTRPGGGSGLLTYGAGKWLGVGGSQNATVSTAAFAEPSLPGAPTSVSATAYDSMVTVNWAAPTSDGGAPITRYTVSSPSMPGGPNCTATGSATSCNVTGLTNGTSYTFSVTARNSAGESASSSVTSPQIPVLCPSNVGGIGPGGGLIFLKDRGVCYEMAPKNWVANDGSYVWCQGVNSAITGARGTAVGTGAANTAAMLAYPCPAGAANAVAAYAGTDSSAGQWFLPSRDEWDAMCSYSINPSAPAGCSGIAANAAFTAGNFGFAQGLESSAAYWTSSLTSWSAYDVYMAVMIDGYQSTNGQQYAGNPMRVRPIRAFTSVSGGSGGGSGNGSGASSGSDVAIPAPVVASPTPTRTPTPSASATPIAVPTPTPTASASASASPTVKAPAGFVPLSASEKVSAQTPVVNAPLSTSLSNAPVVTVPAGTPVAPVVSGLPVNTSLSVGVNSPMRIKQAFVTFGTTRSNASGRAKVPAFKPSLSGTYTIQLATADGKAFYLKVKVAARKTSSASSKPASNSGNAPANPVGK